MAVEPVIFYYLLTASKSCAAAAHHPMIAQLQWHSSLIPAEVIGFLNGFNQMNMQKLRKIASSSSPALLIMVCLLINSRGVDSPDFESKSSSTTASNVMAAEGPWGVPLAAGLPSSSITNTGRRLHHGHGALSSSARAALSVMNHETLGLKQKRRMASGATPARPTSAGPHRHAAGAAAIRTRHHVSSALGRMLLWMGFAGLPAVMPSALGDSPP